jgi:hypothetical protein
MRRFVVLGFALLSLAACATPPPGAVADPNAVASAGRCAENGSCYGDISPVNGEPKTVAVRGYTRADGTYVRGHYRSNGND